MLEGIYYFSAYATHLKEASPDVCERHRTYVSALETTGVHVSMARFATGLRFVPLKHCRFRIWPFRRLVRVPFSRCSVVFQKAEEKETDVAIASKMFELLHAGTADAIVLVSGDTDLLPAIRTLRRLFSSAQIAVVFPCRRHNEEMKKAVARSFKVRKEQYLRFQFPDPVLLPDGKEVRKPANW